IPPPFGTKPVICASGTEHIVLPARSYSGDEERTISRKFRAFALSAAQNPARLFRWHRYIVADRIAHLPRFVRPRRAYHRKRNNLFPSPHPQHFTALPLYSARP